MQDPTEPKHISQLKPLDRAILDEAIREALLLIVASQGKVVTMPLDDLTNIGQTHRLVIEIDRADRVAYFRAERAHLIDEAKPAILAPGGQAIN